MHGLIGTSTRRLVQVIAQINIQLLPCAHIPSTLVRSVHARNTPLEIISTPCKSAVCVLALGKADSERHAVDGALLGYYGVEELDGFAGRGD
jgi:hypothetical protein